MLSDSEDEQQNEQLHKISVNEHYAKAFQYRKEREELDKLKAKLGSDVSESDLEEEETDSESAESEDEDGEELTPAVDAAILRTLARIRQKDPTIYESGKGIFDEEQEKLSLKPASTAPRRKKKKQDETTKIVTMRQAALAAQLESSRSPEPEPERLTHVQEQAVLRKETISAFHGAATADHDEDGEDDLLVLREKTKDEQEQEEEEYRAYLEREVGELRNIIDVGEEAEASIREPDGDEKSRKKKRGASKKRNSKEEEDQEFLVNYILNRGWIDKSKDRVPTYKEITTKSKSRKAKAGSPHHNSSSNDDDLEDDAANHSDSSFDSLNDVFEMTYNFRFEEPNSSTITSFPRSIPSLVRREDTRRKDARERRKERKNQEMEKKKEEVRRLKALKMREIRRKLELIGREGGILGPKLAGKGQGKSVKWEDDGAEHEGDEMKDALKELDLEGDWDPEKHDQQMAELFIGEDGNEEWEDMGDVDGDGKPIWKDDIDIGDIQFPENDAQNIMPDSDHKKAKKKKKKKSGQDENEDVGVDIDTMNADIETLKNEQSDEEWDGTEEMRKRKLDEYMEEIYNLDFNDMVGDTPTRFRYHPVAPQTYSLTPVEILLATDKELNEFMSVKRYAPYRNDIRKWDAKRHKKLKELRSTLAERSKNGGWLTKDSRKDGDQVIVGRGRKEEGEHKPKKRKGKKERMRAKATGNNLDVGTGAETGTGGRDDGRAQIPGDETTSVGFSVDNNKHSTDIDLQKGFDNVEGKGYKRKRGDPGAEAQERQLQKEGKDKEDSNGKPKKKRRRKHHEGREEARQ